MSTGNLPNLITAPEAQRMLQGLRLWPEVRRL